METEEPFECNKPLVNGKRLKVYVWSDWGFLFEKHKWNWIDISWINVATEKAFYKDVFEVKLGIVGFNMSIDWYYGKLEDTENEYQKAKGSE